MFEVQATQRQGTCGWALGVEQMSNGRPCSHLPWSTKQLSFYAQPEVLALRPFHILLFPCSVSRSQKASVRCTGSCVCESLPKGAVPSFNRHLENGNACVAVYWPLTVMQAVEYTYVVFMYRHIFLYIDI